MKSKLILSVITLVLMISVVAQNATMELTFTAENNGQYVPLDSIFVENLTQGGDTTLYAPDTLLVVDYISNIETNEIIGKSSFTISQNYPNPFNVKTEVQLYLLEREHIKISVRDILGRELTHYENTLKQGNHSFAFFAGNTKYYLLNVKGEKTSKTIKMLNTNTNSIYGGKCKIVYKENYNNVIGFKTPKEINNFVFNIGDELQFSSYSDNGQRIIIDEPIEDQTYTFQYATNLPCPGIPTVNDIDGNVYNTVLIGTQCWMKENLKTTTYQNGTPIPNVSNYTTWGSLTTGAYVWYDDDISWKDLYGVLYNWYTTIDTYGLCPTGWHVPSNNEWETLTNFIGGVSYLQGNKLKSCRQINSPLGGECNTTEHPRWNQDNDYGTDDYGFSGLPGGYRDFAGTFYSIGDLGYYWSSTENYSNNSWARVLTYNNSFVHDGYYDKRYGLVVRCLKD